MGIINMAHGELIMVGAYTAYVVQNFFRDAFGSGWRGLSIPTSSLRWLAPLSLPVSSASSSNAASFAFSTGAPRIVARDMGRQPRPATGFPPCLRRRQCPGQFLPVG
jgi:branched-subunit amino acid ABC-type transport system permease component